MSTQVITCRRLIESFAAACALVFSGQAISEMTCRADFSYAGQGVQAVTVNQAADGTFVASINGIRSNPRGHAAKERVRPSLNLKADPYGSEYKTFNEAERALVHLQMILDVPQSASFALVPFNLTEVRSVRVFDLAGKSDKFGGHVLLEAFNEADVLLGRVVRRIFVAACT